MTLNEFDLLSQINKEIVIFEQSEFLFVKTIKGLKIGVYAKDLFFIEVICKSDSLVVEDIKSFNSGQLLSFYSIYLANKGSSNNLIL